METLDSGQIWKPWIGVRQKSKKMMGAKKRKGSDVRNAYRVIIYHIWKLAYFSST